MERPQRAVTLELKIGADSRQELADALEMLSTEAALGEMQPRSVCGGPGYGYHYSYREKSGPTHDEYIEQNREYLKFLKQGSNAQAEVRQ